MSTPTKSTADNGAGNDRARLEAIVAERRAEVARLSREIAPQEWASAQLKLGNALLELAEGLRSEIEAVAGTKKEDEARRAWMDATINTIKEIRFTDYGTARSLVVALQAAPTGYRRKRAVAAARALIEDPKVKLAHGFIKEILEPLTLDPQAKDTGSG